MTLLNTLTNLGGNWPSTLALWCVDPLTVKECQGALANSTVSALDNSCSSPEDTALCTESGGVCATQVTSRNCSSAKTHETSLRGILVGLVQSATLGQHFFKFFVLAQYSILLGKCKKYNAYK